MSPPLCGQRRPDLCIPQVLGVAVRGLIFNFDDVIADSETFANTVLAEAITHPGLPTTLDESLIRYVGKRAAAIESDIGGRFEWDRLLPSRSQSHV